jgi:predicted RNase H-like HicB family nuclease
MDYAVVIEQANDGSFSAYVPDLPGCVACGDSVDEVKQSIREAVILHIESLREHGDPVPPPVTKTWMVHAA